MIFTNLHLYFQKSMAQQRWLRQNSGRFQNQRNEICSNKPVSQLGAPPSAFIFVIVSGFAKEDFRHRFQSQQTVK